MEPAQYANYVDLATQSGDAGDAAITDDMPEVDPQFITAEHEAVLAVIDADCEAATKATRKEARDARQAGDAEDAAARSKRRRATPATGDVGNVGASKSEARPVFELGEGAPVRHAGENSWGVMGQRLMMPNSFWGEEDGAESECTVVGYIGQHSFSTGPRSKYTFVIEYNGHHYAARHTAIANTLSDAAVKRRVRKAGAPRLI